MTTIFDHATNYECIGYYRSLMPYLACKDDLASEAIVIEPRSWMRCAERFDAYIFHRDIGPEVLFIADLLHDLGKVIVWELDDDYWGYPGFHVEQGRRLDTMRSLADWIVTSTPALAEVVACPEKTLVCPNLIDARKLLRTPEVTRETVRILWSGSVTCDEDVAGLPEALDRLTRKYPGKIHVDSMGFGRPGPLAGNPCVREHALVPWEQYYPKLVELRPDIGIVSRGDVPFNRSKTNTKWLEMTQAGAASICTEIEPYSCVRHGEDALVVPSGDAAAWYEALERLILDPLLRVRLWWAAWQRIATEFSWQGQGRQKWLSMYQRITRRP